MADPTNKAIKPYESGKIPAELDDWLRRLSKVLPQVKTYTKALNPASVAANSESTQTFSVTGLKTNDIVIVNKPTKTADLSILDVYASAADTLSITFRNFSGAPIDPGSENYQIVAIRI